MIIFPSNTFPAYNTVFQGLSKLEVVAVTISLKVLVWFGFFFPMNLSSLFTITYVNLSIYVASVTRSTTTSLPVLQRSPFLCFQLPPPIFSWYFSVFWFGKQLVIHSSWWLQVTLDFSDPVSSLPVLFSSPELLHDFLAIEGQLVKKSVCIPSTPVCFLNLCLIDLCPYVNALFLLYKVSPEHK